MTDPSVDILNESSDPLAPTAKPRGWQGVLLVLIGGPFLLALLLSNWLGTPREAENNVAVFHRLGLVATTPSVVHSLYFGELFFVRLEYAEGEKRSEFLRGLTDFVAERGPATRPISLKLERSWWSPPEGVEGTYWKRAETTVWNPDSQAGVFYCVAIVGRANSAGEDAAK